MSLLNIVVGEGVAWAAFDTDGLSLEDGNHYPWSKAVPLVHANTLICGRGERMFLMHVVLGMMVTNGIVDFDSAAEHFPTVLQMAGGSYAQQAAAAGIDVSRFGLEMNIVGWSERRNAPAVLAGIRKPNAASFEIRETRCIVAPAADVASLSTEQEMVALARRQVAAYRVEHADQPIGVDLILAEITRAGMGFRKIADLKAA